jgi:uncharacterized protein
MNPLEIIKKYYDEKSELYKILVEHSQAVAEKALQIARKNPQEDFDLAFVQEASLLHDIGIFMTNAPKIHCFGNKPYICHGYLGSELLQKEGFPRHALICERHTGTGLYLEQIIEQNLPLPHRNLAPVSKEEELICFADKFFSKKHLGSELSIKKIEKSLSKHGEKSLKKFQDWQKRWNI